MTGKTGRHPWRTHPIDVHARASVNILPQGRSAQPSPLSPLTLEVAQAICASHGAQLDDIHRLTLYLLDAALREFVADAKHAGML